MPYESKLTNAGPFKGPKQFFNKTDYNPFLNSIKPSTLALLTVRCNFAEHTYAAQQCRNFCCSRPRTGRLGRDQLRDAGNVRVGSHLEVPDREPNLLFLLNRTMALDCQRTAQGRFC